MFETAPKLNDSAKVILKHQGGIEAFKRHYGDYYVSGYRIGGEAGLLLSVAACAKDVTDTYSFTLAAQAFIFKVSKTYRKFFSEASASSTMTLSGYDTLGSRQITLKGSGTGGGGDIMKLMETANDYENLGQNLDFRIEERMREFSLEPDETIGLEICDAICKSGVVVELLLSPMVTLREVMLWGKNDNII